MQLMGLFESLLLIVVIFLVVRAIIRSIHLFLVVMVVLFFLVLFFDVSLTEVVAWVSAGRVEWLTNLVVNTILFSFGS